MRTGYDSLTRHPQRFEVAALLERVHQLSDAELRGLAEVWDNSVAVARARSRALSPDTRLVVDVLRCFDDVAQLFADDLDGEEAGALDPRVVSLALKAVRDAIAGAIARPVIGRRDAALLMRPWVTVIGDPRGALALGIETRLPVPGTLPGDLAERDRPELTRLLRAVEKLTGRCHDAASAEAFDRILLGAMTRDREDHGTAVDEAYRIALMTGRRRIWSLVRSRTERVAQVRCRTCPPSAAFDDYDRERVTGLCADAACALLVADRLDTRALDVLLEPLSGLIPFPRPPLGA